MIQQSAYLLAYCYNTRLFAMKLYVFQILFIAITSDFALCYEGDKHLRFPKYEKPLNFGFYSGFLKSSDTEENYLFYWFFESQNDPANDPLVIWFDGGPGLSSLLGATSANGPFLWQNDVVVENEYSWNRIANVLYMESPEYVGFSKGSDTSSDTNSTNSNWKAVQSFFKKFPRFLKNTLYLSGESYAGVYVPNLAFEILASTNPKIDLGGIFLGNPAILLDTDIKAFHVTTLDYAHISGLISTFEYQQKSSELPCGSDQDDCEDFWDFANDMHDFLKGRSIYDINRKCDNNSCMEIIYKCKQNSGFFNDQEVQDFFSTNKSWNGCKSMERYTFDNMNHTKHYIDYIIGKDIPFLVFTGKSDMICNWLQVEYFLKNYLKLSVVSDWSSIVSKEDNVVIGMKKQWQSSVSHIVIDGAPHSVVRSHKRLALQMLTEFIQQTTLASHAYYLKALNILTILIAILFLQY